MGEIKTGTSLSPDDVELLKKYRDLCMPAARLGGLDDFAKWLFTSVSIIGSVGAAFSTTAVKAFNTSGAIAFFAGILFAGISLFLAVWLRAVQPAWANYQNLEDMVNKHRAALTCKQRLAWWSGLFFALGLLIASAAPLLTVGGPRPQSPSSLSYSFGKDGVHATASLGSRGRLAIVAVDPTARQTVLATQLGVPGDDHIAKLDLTAAVPNSTTEVRLLIDCRPGSAAVQQTMTIPLASAGGSPMSAKLQPPSGCVE
jgi:hypothetical protein